MFIIYKEFYATSKKTFMAIQIRTASVSRRVPSNWQHLCDKLLEF